MKDLNQTLSGQSAFINECERKTKETQIKDFGKESKPIAAQCEWTSNGYPISLGIPVFPDSARKTGIRGAVKVEIIIDEQGKIVFANAVSGRKIFHANAERAASLSLYNPKIVCGKAVMQKKFLVYNFIPD